MPLFIAPVSADPSMDIQRLESVIEDLYKRIGKLQQQVDELKKAEKEEAQKRDESIKLKAKWKGAPEFSSSDGAHTMKVRGRLLTDYAHLRQDGNNSGDVDATEFRTARIGVEGTIASDFGYKAEVDFADNEVDLKDAYLEYTGLDVANITLGQFKHPASLEEQTSSRYITFMERAAFTDAFELSRRIGLGVSGGGENWTGSTGIFGEETGDSENSREGWLVGARGTYAPIFTDTRSIHLGVSAFYRKNNRDENTIRYRARPGVHLAERFVNTGRFSADRDWFYGIEAAGIYGPLSLQGEFAQIRPDVNDGSDPTFSGWYASASYFLTGESRNYKANKGQFGRVKPRRSVTNGGWGAWELATRFDSLDLSNKEIRGGEQKAFLVGVNWYLMPHVRLMANYIHADISQNRAAPVAGEPSNSIDAIEFRGQIDF